eukprot:m.152337 g.152337  ORF g.152337 m.152337 type:complete len:57 (-) comp15051_c0_seq6:1402-1572(-)
MIVERDAPTVLSIKTCSSSFPGAVLVASGDLHFHDSHKTIWKYWFTNMVSATTMHC